MESQESQKQKQQAMTNPLAKGTSKMTNHAFWGHQPVPQSEIELQKNDNPGPIEKKKLSEVSKDPLQLPENYKWCQVNLQNEEQLNEVYELLRDNYVEDDDAMFRFDYSKDFLKWTLNPPGYRDTWVIGVRYEPNNKLVGFITAVPVKIKLEQEEMIKMSEINFLCVEKTIRKKKLAVLLIKEITRRCNLKKVWQAVYTAGVKIPTPFSQSRYYHRSLNPSKLVDIGFCGLSKNQTVKILKKMYKLDQETNIPGLRPMTKKDVPKVTELLNTYLSKFNLQIVFNEQEVAHFFIPKEGVIYTYVVCNDGKVTDMLSFYQLFSSILKHPKHKTLRSCYSYYNVNTSVTMEKLIENALILANNLEFDVFNMLDLMDNAPIFQDLMFSPGDGYLHYYLYNWKTSHQFQANELGMVLV